jgi:hypothetical protein
VERVHHSPIVEIVVDWQSIDTTGDVVNALNFLRRRVVIYGEVLSRNFIQFSQRRKVGLGGRLLRLGLHVAFAKEIVMVDTADD